MSMEEFKIGFISDLDKQSKDEIDGDIVWKSLLKYGKLTKDEVKGEVSLKLDGENTDVTIVSEYSRGMRGMELSELVTYNDQLYSIDDRTGIVFRLSEGKSIPWVILSDGDGNQSKGFKGEWMTQKDGKLIVGAHGREFIDFDGNTILHRNYQYIKIIDCKGGVEHVNWVKNYNAIREGVGCPYPGYLIHESCAWSEVHKQWFFLPRKVSKEQYDEKLDETRAGNILIRCSEDFKDIKYQPIGELRPTRGYSSFKFIPGTKDSMIIAIKSEELGDAQKSFVTVFTIDGQILLDDQHLGDAKYEGVEFI